MLAALRTASEALPYGVQSRFALSDADLRILERAQADVASIPSRAFEQRAQLCAAVLQGDYLSIESAPSLAQQLTLIDTYYADAAIPYFNRVLAQLSGEAARGVLTLKSRLTALQSARAVDWQAYAAADPAELVNSIYASCRP